MWKGKLVDRDWLKERLRAGFKEMATGNLEEKLGALVNDLESYLAGELLLNTKEVMGGLVKELEGAMGFLEKFADGITERQIRRRAVSLTTEDEDTKA